MDKIVFSFFLHPGFVSRPVILSFLLFCDLFEPSDLWQEIVCCRGTLRGGCYGRSVNVKRSGYAADLTLTPPAKYWCGLIALCQA